MMTPSRLSPRARDGFKPARSGAGLGASHRGGERQAGGRVAGTVPRFSETPQHGKCTRRDDFLERYIVGRHSLCLHNGASYFRRRERPRGYPQSVLRKPGQFIMGGRSHSGDSAALAGMKSGFVPGENDFIVASKFARIRPLARDPFFEVVNVAADFSAPAAG